MRGYKQLFVISVRSVFAYRLNAVLGLIGSMSYLIGSLAVWHALIGQGSIGGYDWPAMKAYLVVSWATLQLGGPGIEWRMADRILWGEVATDLTKPVDYQSARFAEYLGRLTMELCTIAVAIAGVAIFTGGFPLPEQPLLFVASFLLVIPLKFTFIYISCMVCFWTHNYMGVAWAKHALITLFSGALIPLALLPTWLAAPAAVLPFASMTAGPASIYLGQSGVIPILIQFVWIVVLWLAARLLWRTALRALTVHGG